MQISKDIYQRVVTAKLYIDNNYAEPIDLKKISGKAFLSRFHFHRLFTKIYRKTPHQYLTNKRIEKAKVLLAENKPVAEVCNEVGFESMGSFSVLFKKEIGFAPQYYRNMAWLKKQQAKAQPMKFIPHCFIESYKLEEIPDSRYQMPSTPISLLLIKIKTRKSKIQKLEFRQVASCIMYPASIILFQIIKRHLIKGHFIS